MPVNASELAGARAPKPPPTARAHRYEQLIGWLAAHVRQHDLDVGDRLPAERAMAAQAGISRASVRQGLTALRAKGVVEVRAGDGTYLVRPMRDAESVEILLSQRHRLPEVMEAREALEVEAARLAAVRRTQADLDAIGAAIDRMAQEVDAGGYGLEGDARFHQAVTAAARNRVISELMGHLAWSLAEVRVWSLRVPERRTTSLDQHRAIAAALRAGDPEHAVRTTREHLAHVAEAQAVHRGDLTP